jgi:hypothetical protein
MPVPPGSLRRTHLMKLQRLQNSSPRYWQPWQEHISLRFALGVQNSVHVYYITKLCRRQAEVILNHENPNVHGIGQGEPRHRKYESMRGLNLVADKPTTVQVSNCRFLGLNKLRHKQLHYPALTDVPVYSRTYESVCVLWKCIVCIYPLL